LIGMQGAIGRVGPRGLPGQTGSQGAVGATLPSGAYIELPSGSPTPSGFTKIGSNEQLSFLTSPFSDGSHNPVTVTTNLDLFQKN
jgi:hypothetical protein